MTGRTLVIATFALLVAAGLRPALAADPTPAPVSYSQVHAVFAKHCLSCHAADEPEGQLVLESHEALMKGGENGPAVVPGKAAESLLVQLIEHTKKPYMPPPRKAAKLKADEIALVRAWIDQGAKGPAAGEIVAVRPVVPKIAAKVAPRRPVRAIAFEPKAKLLAVAQAGDVELRTGEGDSVVRKLGSLKGHVYDLAFTTDGGRLLAVGGMPGHPGEVKVWSVADGKLQLELTGHKDAIHSAAFSPDGQTFATGSYDHDVILWDASNGKPRAELAGHQGAVFGLSFRADGKVLASASADRTLKLWDAAGKRLDTRPEASKDLFAAAFSPDGARLAAAGADNRIRIWRISTGAVEGTNPLLLSQFAHEGAILRLAWSADGKTLATSADDRTVKLWDASSPAASELKPKHVLEKQPDWPTALAFGPEGKTVVVGRLDGTMAVYDVAGGKPVPPPKPDVSDVEPNAMQRGQTVKVKLTGKGLGRLTAVAIAGADAKKPTARLLPDESQAGAAVIEITAAADLAPGSFDLTVTSPGGTSAPVQVHVDTLAQAWEAEPNDDASKATALSLPTTVWGKFAPRGDRDHFAFDAKSGQTIVLDIASRRIGGKADVVLAVVDATGKVLATASGEGDDPDPLLAFTPPAAGRYIVRITDRMHGSSPQHFYRLSIGSFAYVTGCFPLGVPANAESSVRLLGYNLPADASVKVKAGAFGDVTLPLDPAEYRTRRVMALTTGVGAEIIESEPNDPPAKASQLPVPGGASGRFGTPGDADLYRIEAKAGQLYIIETQAARRGSPADTRVEVLHADGKPVPRVQLRAVRDSYINFRAIDAVNDGCRFQNWEEMELNQFMYMNGEVVKLFLAPRGPDADYKVYTSANGKRRTYFDTTATSHALDERTYIVEPHAPDATFPANGLPVFPLNYVNDDDALRELGSDSRLHFTAPADGTYLVRVTDSRSFGGDDFAYRVSVRPAKPDFDVTVEFPPNVPAGSGRNFTVRVNRIDAFEEPVRVELANVPEGLIVSNPVVIEAGHIEAKGTVFAAKGGGGKETSAKGKPAKISTTATAEVDGRNVTRSPKETMPPKIGADPGLVVVTLLPGAPTGATTAPATQPAPATPEITIAPGQLVPAMLRIQRHGFTERVSFDLENLPHGIIVADIGLSGVLVREGETERPIFLQCAPWVEETDRLCHARAREAGNPTSPPVLIKVRRPAPARAAREPGTRLP